MKFRVYPYKQGSASAKTLATHLKGKVLKREGSIFHPKSGDYIINWGSSSLPDFGPATVLNPDLNLAQNKLKTFEVLKNAEVSHPSFWTDKNDIPSDVYPIVCRTILNGHSGAGIVIANSPDQLVSAPLYVRYVKKKDEYRVHVMSSPDDDPDVTQYTAFFIQRKAKKLDVQSPNWLIRNLAGGFAFKEVGYNDVPTSVIDQSYRTIKALGLDFGAVDVIYNEKQDKAYILEVNTACGLEDRTAEKYKEAFYALASA